MLRRPTTWVISGDLRINSLSWGEIFNCQETHDWSNIGRAKQTYKQTDRHIHRLVSTHKIQPGHRGMTGLLHCKWCSFIGTVYLWNKCVPVPERRLVSKQCKELNKVVNFQLRIPWMVDLIELWRHFSTYKYNCLTYCILLFKNGISTYFGGIGNLQNF